MDSTGLKSSAKREEELKEYGVKRLLLPLAGTKTEKDVSDYFMLGNSREDLIKLFLDYLETFMQQSQSLTKEQVKDAMNKHLSADKLVVVTAGPTVPQKPLPPPTDKPSEQPLGVPEH